MIHYDNLARANTQLERENILILEDEELMSALLGRYIKSFADDWQWDFQYKSLESGWDLLTTDLSHIQVAVVDLLLPKVTGVDLIRNFRKRYPHMGFIPISGMATEPMKRELGQILDGKFPLLTKPLRKDAFAEAFKAAWAHSQNFQAPKDDLQPSSSSDIKSLNLKEKNEAEEPMWTGVSASAKIIPIGRKKVLNPRKIGALDEE